MFEASSHGLDQKRFGDLQINHAIFTNLTKEHLDYHLNMENYFKAKSLLEIMATAFKVLGEYPSGK